jgi:hypothetical protein
VDFLVRRDDIRQCRFGEEPPPDLEPGQVLLEVESFGLTSNNVTYAVMGDAMSYWRFFPAEEGWGRVPVWGFARVVASSHDSVPEGGRVYGYLPPSTHLVVSPERVADGGFVDGSAHRADLPAVYNQYTRAAGHGGEEDDRQILFRPLFGTSFLIDDFLEERGFLDDAQVVISSASSKTALGTAFLLSRRDGVRVVGLTSPARAGFVEGLEVYDRVAGYDALDGLEDGRTVYVDISGDAGVRASVHERFGESLAYDCLVGASHWDRLGAETGPVAGPAPELFFAPDRFAKRASDWGPGGLQSRVRDAWDPFGDWLSGWLRVIHGSGPADVERAYLELVEGEIDPATGYVMTLSGASAAA